MSLPSFSERAVLVLCLLVAFHAWRGQRALMNVKVELDESISAAKSLSDEAWSLASNADDRINRVERC